MPCDITLGRAVQCKNVLGGLRAVYIMNFVGNAIFGVQDDIVDTVSPAANAYKYELKGASTFEQSVISSRENGSTYVEQKLTLDLKKLSIADHKQLKILSYGKPRIFVEDNNGNIFLAGLTKGMELVTSTIYTGAAMGDMSGYKIEFLGTENIAAIFKDSDISFVEMGITVITGTVA